VHLIPNRLVTVGDRLVSSLITVFSGVTNGGHQQGTNGVFRLVTFITGLSPTSLLSPTVTIGKSPLVPSRPSINPSPLTTCSDLYAFPGNRLHDIGDLDLITTCPFAHFLIQTVLKDLARGGLIPHAQPFFDLFLPDLLRYALGCLRYG
jgi:hypothetical protein